MGGVPQTGQFWRDRQREPPAGWCIWCGREIYPGEEAWRAAEGNLHEDCVGDYARQLWPHGYLGMTEEGEKA